MPILKNVPVIGEELPEGVSINVCDDHEGKERSIAINNFFQELPGLNLLEINILPNEGEGSKVFILSRYSKLIAPSILKPTTLLQLELAKIYGLENVHTLTMNNAQMSPRAFLEAPLQEAKATWVFFNFMRNLPISKGLTMTSCVGSEVPQMFIDAVKGKEIDFYTFLDGKAPEDDKAKARVAGKYYLPHRMAGMQGVKFLNYLYGKYPGLPFVDDLTESFLNTIKKELGDVDIYSIEG
jgi:hypothetical protein